LDTTSTLARKITSFQPGEYTSVVTYVMQSHDRTVRTRNILEVYWSKPQGEALGPSGLLQLLSSTRRQ